MAQVGPVCAVEAHWQTGPPQPSLHTPPCRQGAEEQPPPSEWQKCRIEPVSVGGGDYYTAIDVHDKNLTSDF